MGVSVTPASPSPRPAFSHPPLAASVLELIQPPLENHAGLIAALWAENKRLCTELQALRQENEALRTRLTLEIAKRFGPSSERRPAPGTEPPAAPVSPVPPPAAVGETVPAPTETSAPPLPAGTETSTGAGRKRRKRGAQNGHSGHGRQIPAALPREEQEHALPENERQCPQCGLPYKDCGLTDDSEEVDVRIKIVVIRHQRKCYHPTCTCPAARPLLVAPLPPKLIPKGKFTIQTWVKFLLDKYLAQIPVHRQCVLLAQAGLPVCQGTVHGGFKFLYDYLLPLYEHFLAHLRQMEHLAADETRWLIFEELAGKANHRWWLWLYASTDVICLVLDPHRSAAAAFKALGEPLSAGQPVPLAPGQVTREIEGQTYIFTPALKSISADRYPVYPALSPYVYVAFCWAHQRRDFTDFQTAQAAQPAWVAWAEAWVATIAQLYALNEARLAVVAAPQAFAAAQLALEQALAAVAQQVAARAELPAPQRKILESMHNHWAGLTYFVDHPEIPMDNNWAERLLRLPVVGRKNYYGHQTQRAGEMGAMLFSFILTCQLHAVSPFDFLVRYFQACAEHGGPPPDLTPFSPWLKPAAPASPPASLPP